MEQRVMALTLEYLRLVDMKLDMILNQLSKQEAPTDVVPKKHIVTVEVATVADIPTVEQDNLAECLAEEVNAKF